MPDTWSTPAAPPQYSTKRASNANEQVLGLYQRNFGRSASSFFLGNAGYQQDNTSNSSAVPVERSELE